jgi:hypothetical protein
MSDEQVRLTLPCTPRFARVARTAAAACGVLEGFTVDEIGDLRLLVDEVFVAMLALGATAVELVLTPRDGRVGVLMSASGELGPPRGGADDSLARSLAAVVASDVDFRLAAPHPTFAATVSAAG